MANSSEDTNVDIYIYFAVGGVAILCCCFVVHAYHICNQRRLKKKLKAINNHSIDIMISNVDDKSNMNGENDHDIDANDAGEFVKVLSVSIDGVNDKKLNQVKMAGNEIQSIDDEQSDDSSLSEMYKNKEPQNTPNAPNESNAIDENTENEEGSDEGSDNEDDDDDIYTKGNNKQTKLGEVDGLSSSSSEGDNMMYGKNNITNNGSPKAIDDVTFGSTSVTPQSA